MELLVSGAQKLNISLTQKQIDKFEIYYHELTEWNDKINLTHITDYAEVQIKHFLDSLTLTMVWQPAASDYVIDVGTGAGLPGIPLNIVYPDFKLVLLEATGKKVSFLNHIIEKLGLHNAAAINGRAEDIGQQEEYREKFDIVICRAVAEMATAAELSLPFCKTSGRFVASKKGETAEEISHANKAIELLGGKVEQNKEIDMTEFTDSRRLVVIKKASLTPDKYPRRAGMPEKRPIR